MRVVIYGFGPYRHFQSNVTERILRQLPKRRWLKKIVFPVKFHKSQFVAAINKYKPDVVLGLGQCSRGRRLRIEAKAVNKRRNNKREKSRRIIAGGSPSVSTSLKPDLGPQATISKSAGDYVCNYSMYVILDFLKRHYCRARFGFIHVPHRYDVRKAVRCLKRAVDTIEAGG